MFPKKDFPIFSHYPQLHYLDNAATTQKPRVVIDALTRTYQEANAHVHRGIYELGERATLQYNAVRSLVAHYCGAVSDEIIFTRNATEGINFIASSWASKQLKSGDEIIISMLEHHANILPWIRLEQEQGIILKYIPLTFEGNLDYEAYESLITTKTKLIAITHTSNVLGTKVDIKRVVASAKRVQARVLLDATQAAGREHLSLGTLGIDFAVFSGHKMLGPTGIGILYIAQEMQDEVAPYQLGGGMVHSVNFHEYTVAKSPYKYEAGTPAIADALALGTAIEYLTEVSFEALKKYEAGLCARLIDGLLQIRHISILGPIDQLRQSGHMVSFVSSKAHAHDVATYLDRVNICVRAGNHCAQPLHRALGVDASVRASVYGYTVESDIELLIQALDSL